MRKISILLIGIFTALSSIAKDYSPAEIDKILKENATLKSENAQYSEMASQAISSLKENKKIKAILKNAGLSIDAKTSSLNLIDGDSFMTACNVVLFTEEEFNAMDANAPKAFQNVQRDDNVRKQENSLEKDFREVTKGDFSEGSKNFWNNVIY